MIDLGRLRALDAVARYGTVLAAGTALHCTPSAVSQQLSKLERETGTTLVEKDGRRLRLTDAGRMLAEHAVGVLAAVDEAESAIAAHRDTVSGRLVIASFATACRALLPHALRSLADQHPALSTGLRECDPHEALDALVRGHADVAVLDDWPEVSLRFPPGVEHVELGLDTADLLVPKDHPLAGARAVARARIRDERWISAVPGAICYEWLLRVLPGVSPDLVVGEFETQITLVAAGLGVAMVPRLARPELPEGVVAVPVRPTPTRRVSVAWRSTAAVRPATTAAVAALRDAWAARGLPRVSEGAPLGRRAEPAASPAS
jgi:DNA-binding transcriptional LysR family regulator